MRNSRSSRLGVGLLLIAATATASIAVWATRARQHTDTFRAENKTRSLALESVTEVGDLPAENGQRFRRLTVTVRNKHDKPIVAYRFRQEDSSLAEGDTAGIETNGATIGWSLPPNARDVTHVTAPSDDNAALILAAVLFEDGTGEGDADDLAALRNYRAGVKQAYERIVPLLRRAANPERPATLDAINSLKNEVAALPVENTGEGGYAHGFADGQSLVVRELGELEEQLRSGRKEQARPAIGKTLTHIEDVLAKL